MRNYVLGVIMTIEIYIDIAVAIIAGIALLVSYFSYKESKKMRLESGRAFLTIELLQTKEGLYALLSNIGNTCAYDMTISLSDCFTNGFKNLNIIRPGYSYRFLLLKGQDISAYPEEIKFELIYNDCYSPKHGIRKAFSFKIIDSLKFDISYNHDFDCYDITKSF